MPVKHVTLTQPADSCCDLPPARVPHPVGLPVQPLEGRRKVGRTAADWSPSLGTTRLHDDVVHDRLGRCGEQFVNAKTENVFEEPSSCRTELSEGTATDPPASGEALKVPDAQGAGFLVLTGVDLGVLGELLERLPPLPDFLLQHGSECPHLGPLPYTERV
jgi:hypothetical protein